VNWVNHQKRTPLHLAVISRNEEVVKALLKVGANVNIQVARLYFSFLIWK
jgi:ankyrin repeat protein